MTEIEFKRRTKKLALEIIRFVDALPRSRSADVLTGQLLRSATSVAANYRAACRAKSIADALRREAEEILAMTVASIKTLRAKSQSNPKSKI